MTSIQEEEGNAVTTTKKLKKRKFIIEDVIMKNKARVEPLFVEFANGRPFDNSSLTATLHQNMSNDARRRRRRVLTVPTEKVSYAGTNFGAHTRRGDTTTFLGVLDKTTGKMRLIETSTYCMRPILSTTTKPAKESLLDESLHTLTYLEKQEAVVTAFGSKRAKLAVNRRRQYQVDGENMATAIDQVAEVAVVKKVEELEWEMENSQPDSLQSILPPCDKEASRIENVYKLEDLAPDSFLTHYEEAAYEQLDNRYPDSSFSILVMELLSCAQAEKTEEKKMRLCCIALFVHNLLGFLRLQSSELKKTSPQNCPEAVYNYLIKEYTTGKPPYRKKSATNEDRVSCLALILSFIANKYVLTSNTVLYSMPFTKERLSLMMKIIGATYQASTQTYTLKVPLFKLPRKHIPVLGREKKKKGRV